MAQLQVILQPANITISPFTINFVSFLRKRRESLVIFIELLAQVYSNLHSKFYLQM